MSSESSLLASVTGAIEGSVSVLLTLLAGYAVTRSGLLDRPTIKKMSNVASLVFLPCLIIVQMGPSLTPDLLRRVWIIPAWGMASTLLAHAFGFLGQKVLGLPNWTIVAAGRPNSSALPLLLVDALASTGVLDEFKKPGESTSAVLDRAKSLILLNVVVQQAFTFAAGPSILTRGQDHEDHDRLLPGPHHGRPTIQDTEHVGLLRNHDGEDGYGATADPHRFEGPLRQLENQPDLHWPEKIRFMQKPVEKVASFMEPPVVGAIIALILGMVSPLRHLFLDEDGLFFNSITKAFDNLGSLFVSLQMFTVGAQLASVPSTAPKFKPTSFVLLIRYAIMPMLAIAFVWFTAGRGIYSDDPLVWFLLILIPSGPSAMVLANLAELVDTDQGPIAGYLTVAYCLSPLIAFSTTGGLAVVQKLTA